MSFPNEDVRPARGHPSVFDCGVANAADGGWRCYGCDATAAVDAPVVAPATGALSPTLRINSMIAAWFSATAGEPPAGPDCAFFLSIHLRKDSTTWGGAAWLGAR